MSQAQANLAVTEEISGMVLSTESKPRWWIGFTVAFFFMMVLLYSVTILFIRGVGIWGIRIPVGWGFAITNFVWWIGIGHAGTFISAFLLLLRQKWRNSINRCAEAMTLFAVACAGLYPILHLGRPELFYWLLPYPNTMDIGPQFRSPLMWDIFAVLTYLTVSILFWYLGLMPDLATMRDKSKNIWARRAYGIFAFGWKGSSSQWRHFQVAAMLLAGLATPLVISVHSIVSIDFAGGIVPGWHSTIFPPFFVAGALYSGFAMVLTLLIPVRHFYHIENLITEKHIENISFIALVTGTIVAYGYTFEILTGLYSGDIYDHHMIVSRFTGVYSPFFIGMLAINFIVPQLLWSERIRKNMKILFVLALLINVGMWLERFIIVVQSTSEDFLPSSWGVFTPTFWDWSTFLGTFGLFFSLLFLFFRVLPALSIAEVKDEYHEEGPKEVHP
jgi:Ni/Fe-hydrogenase subunit HybB-like protein